MEKETLSEKIYTQIREKILTTELSPNFRLKEQHWADILKTGRLTVREALNRLQGEGLVYRGKRGGFFVTSFSDKDLKELRQIRRTLELGALHLCQDTDYLDEKALAGIEEYAEDYNTLVDKAYFSSAKEADRRLHYYLMQLPGNSRLTKLYDLSQIPFINSNIPSHDDVKFYKLAAEEHFIIIKHLRKKEFTKACEILSTHISRIGKRKVDW